MLASYEVEICSISGALPIKEDGSMYKGKIGAGMDEKTGYAAARRAAMVLTANILSEVSDLSKVRILKITGFVNCSPDFEHIPAVVNGASDLFVEVFNENGKHISRSYARSAVGVASLPLGVPVEVEAIAEILHSILC